MDVDAPPLTLSPAEYDGSAARALVAGLDADLALRYPGGDSVIADASQFATSTRGAFFIARLGSDPAGCAGLRLEADGVAELKRMWVVPALRGRGVARALLARCESAAAELGYAELWLETGVAQPEAVSLYASAGYRSVPPFGQWAGHPSSIALGKRLTGNQLP